MSDSIRVQRPGKKIEVNDSGEYIVLEIKNTTFMNNLICLMKELETASNNLLSQVSQDENGSVDEISSAIGQAADVCGKLAARTDEVFGEGTCRKVFGKQAPGIYELADFFSQIGDLLHKYTEEESAEISGKISRYKAKYNGGGEKCKATTGP